jgi:hypothetical protein
LSIGYTEQVARGWESKSVEEQINERQAETQHPGQTQRNPQEIQQNAKRNGILLARSRTMSTLESTRDERYRTLLQRTLDYLDAELLKLDKTRGK